MLHVPPCGPIPSARPVGARWTRALLTVGLLLGAARWTEAQATGDTKGAAEVVAALFAATERGDLAALDTLYLPNATIVEGAGLDRGWARYRDHHLAPELRAFKNFRYRVSDVETVVTETSAWAMFRYTLRAELEGRVIDQVGRGTVILERHDGRWRVRHEQTSSRPRRPTDAP